MDFSRIMRRTGALAGRGLLPVMIGFAVLTLSVRIGDIAGFSSAPVVEVRQASADGQGPLRFNDHVRRAQEKNARMMAEREQAENGAGDRDGVSMASELTRGARAPLDDGAGAQGDDARDLVVSEDVLDMSAIEMDMLKDLAARREALKQREQELVAREALLKAAERSLDAKTNELALLRDEIETLLGKRDEQEQKQIDSLVQIYEAMKPKDAAAILNTLDMNVLLPVVSAMKERKTAPVLAKMDPEIAREVTARLAERLQLPELPPGSDPGF